MQHTEDLNAELQGQLCPCPLIHPAFHPHTPPWPFRAKQGFARDGEDGIVRKKEKCLHPGSLQAPCLRQVRAGGGKSSHWMRVQSFNTEQN